MSVYRAIQRHMSGFIRVYDRGRKCGFILKILPDTLSGIQHVDEYAVLALLTSVGPSVGRAGVPVGRHQALVVQALDVINGFHVLGLHPYGNQLSVNLCPSVAAPEPGLDDVKRPCMLGHLHTDGVIHAVSVGIAVGKCLQHLLHRFRRVGLGQVVLVLQLLKPVSAVAQTITAYYTGSGNGNQLAVYSQVSRHFLGHAGQVGILCAVPYIFIQIHESPLLCRLYHIGRDSTAPGNNMRHGAGIRQVQCILVRQSVVGHPGQLHVYIGVVLNLIQNLLSVLTYVVAASVHIDNTEGDGLPLTGRLLLLGGLGRLAVLLALLT